MLFLYVDTAENELSHGHVHYSYICSAIVPHYWLLLVLVVVVAADDTGAVVTRLPWCVADGVHLGQRS